MPRIIGYILSEKTLFLEKDGGERRCLR